MQVDFDKLNALAQQWSYLKGEVFDVLLHGGVAPRSSNQTLGIEDRVLGVRGQLVLRSVSDETLSFGGEGHV